MGRRRSNIIYWSGNHQIFWRQTTLVWWIRTYWETSMSNWLDFAIKLTEGILENARNYWNESKSRSGNLKMGNISNSQKIVYFLNIQVSSLSKWISLKKMFFGRFLSGDLGINCIRLVLIPKWVFTHLSNGYLRFQIGFRVPWYELKNYLSYFYNKMTQRTISWLSTFCTHTLWLYQIENKH